MTKSDAAKGPKHSLSLEDRHLMKLSGVKEVTGFSDSSVNLKTAMGALLVQGRELNISRLDTDTGELSVNGEIRSLRYSKDRGAGLFEGLFK